MRIGGLFKEVNGLIWPACDIDCMAVSFANVSDSDKAIKYCTALGTAVQAGGNTGVWPIHLSKIFDRVHTFEPEPMNYACLRHNCSRYDNIYVMLAGLGETDSMSDMEYPEGKRNMGAARMVPNPKAGKIPIYSLDGLGLQKVDFIQLDVEGFEPFVIAGAKELIAKWHPVIMLEDKGLSSYYSSEFEQDWSEKYMPQLGYRLAERIHRDKVFVYDE